MRRDFIVFPVVDWSFQRQRPQQIAIELGRRGHRVFYLTERFAPANLPRPYLFWSSPAHNVYVVQLRCPEPHPNIYKTPATPAQIDSLVAGIDALRRSCGVFRPVCLVDLPFWHGIVKAMASKVVVYDCMDHHAGFENNDPGMLVAETALIEEADLVMTTSTPLAARISQARLNVLIRNGCDAAHFRAADTPIRRGGGRPVVGYFGSLDHWFDTGLVARAARAYPAWHFVLIGRRQNCDLRALRRIANVEIFDEVPYQVLPKYAHGFDVGMIPFSINDLTRHTNPVKMYEYLAAGKPVVATAMPEIMIGGDGLTYAARDGADFIVKLGEAMARSADPACIARRIAYAASATWARRVDQLESELSKIIGDEPRADSLGTLS